MKALMTNIYTIPSDLCFVTTLAEGLWRRVDGDPLKLAETTIYLPTRRACRNLREAFLRVTGAKAALLPRMRPLGDVDEDELGFADVGALDGVLPAISSVRRQMLLAQLIRKKEQALPLDLVASLASTLALLLDQMQTEEKSFDELSGLVSAEDGAKHWQETLAFLEIITKAWPALLLSEGCLDPAQRRASVIDALIATWKDVPPSGPIIAAGSTGSVPVVGRLIKAIAALPQGEVILPGLDLSLDEDAWQEIEETHPQYTMKHWLQTADVCRADVALWENAKTNAPTRLKLLRESMRPAAVTDAWRGLTEKDLPVAAYKGLEKIECDHHREEADVIALRLRAALQEDGKTVALITPDRALAKRVVWQLQRWGIVANDSAGQALDTTKLGSFLIHVLAASSLFASPIDYLALLKHPLMLMGKARGDVLSFVRRAEILVWRGVRPAGGFEALVRIAQAEGDDDLAAWLEGLSHIMKPLTESWGTDKTINNHMDAHLIVAEQLAASEEKTGRENLWRGDAGDKAVSWLDEWRQASHDFPDVYLSDYKALCVALMRGQVVRPRYGVHPRLSILGPLEARLQHHDMIILGGLNEKSWPPAAAIDPWMSRPMKRELALPTPERRIGLSAHDFVSLAAARHVVLTRARRVGRVPTVPSRFLLQITAVLESTGQTDLSTDKPWRAWAQSMDEPQVIKPMLRPAPRPATSVRPTHLSVTEIGTWIRNPYGIYAKRILKLRKLDDIDADVNAADKGSAIHKALEEFMKIVMVAWPDDPLALLLEKGRDAFAPLQDKPQIQAFWWPRFERMAVRFVAREKLRRKEGYRPAYLEVKGTLQVTEYFSLTGQVDRIDYTPRNEDGAEGAIIIDYKTGATPSGKMVKAGFEPQLPLLAIMGSQGAFDGGEILDVQQLAYWEIKGARAADKIVNFESKDIEDLVIEARNGLRELIQDFSQKDMPYRAYPKPKYIPRYDDYVHLARFTEWSQAAGDET